MSVERPPHVAAHRFEALDALRGVCALLVALYHFDAPGVVSTSRLIGNSYLFVDYFFVLSGFVIAFSYGNRLASGEISTARFMALRAGRIYPLHLAMIGAYFALELMLWMGSDWLYCARRSLAHTAKLEVPSGC